MLIHLENKKYHFWIQGMSTPELTFIDPTYKINYDIEQQEKNEWLLHIDAGVEFDKKGAFESRSTFKALCAEDNIFDSQMLLPAVKKSIQYARKRLTTEMRNYEADCPPVAKTTSQTWKLLTGEVIYLHKLRSRLTDEDTKKNTALISLDPDWETQFLITFTLQIIFTLISRGYPFKREENKKVFFNHVPEPLWKRIYFKCNRIREHKVELTMKEIVILYYCIDCAAQCMAGKTFEKLKCAIYDLDIQMRGRDVDNERKTFLVVAQTFMENLKATLARAGIGITNFDTPIFWDEQISAL